MIFQHIRFSGWLDEAGAWSINGSFHFHDDFAARWNGLVQGKGVFKWVAIVAGLFRIFYGVPLPVSKPFNGHSAVHGAGHVVRPPNFLRGVNSFNG